MPRSAEADRFQIIVRLDHFDQPVLGRPVAPVGVGVVTFHQFLEPRLNLLRRSAHLEPERAERLALGIADRTLLLALLLLIAQAFAKQPERIGAGAAQIGPRPALAGAHLPGRAMTGERVLLIGQHGVVFHAGEKIIRLIVFARVREAEVPIVLVILLALGRAVGSDVLASRPFARRAAGFLAAILVRFDADFIEKR